jgi:predicted sulfurtransferase
VRAAIELDIPAWGYIRWMRTLLILAAFAAQLARSSEAPRISQADFKKLRASGKVVVVDTRNKEAYDRAHIPGAILLPVEGLRSWPAEYDATVEQLKSAKKLVVTYRA